MAAQTRRDADPGDYLRRRDDDRRERRIRVASSACCRCSRPDVRAFESGLPPMATGTSVPADDFGFPSGHVATTAAWALRSCLVSSETMAARRGSHMDRADGPLTHVPGTPFPRGCARWPRRRCRGASPRTPGAFCPAAAGISTLTAGTQDGPWCVAHRRRRARRAFRAPDSALMMPAASVASWARPSCSCTRGRSTIPSRRRRGWPAWLVALVLLGAALWSSTWTITTGPGLAAMSTMAISAALHASVLLVPALALGGHRS